MTVLDQAFIKAYTTQHDAIPPTMTSAIASPVPLSEALAGGYRDQVIEDAKQRGPSRAVSCTEGESGESPSDLSAGKPQWPLSPVDPTRQAAPTVDALAIPPLQAAKDEPPPRISATDVGAVSSGDAAEASADGQDGSIRGSVTPRFSLDSRPSLDDDWAIRVPDSNRLSDAEPPEKPPEKPPEEPQAEDLLLRATPSSCFPPPESRQPASAEDTTKTEGPTATVNAVIVECEHPAEQAGPQSQVEQAGSLAASSRATMSTESSQPSPNEIRDGRDRGTFRPALHVDRFAWPPNCSQLSRVAAHEVNRLADSMILAMSRGQKVMALVGVAPRQGCTTLVLCAAKRLAERGLNVAIIDADMQRPLLAAALGLLPEVGWEDVLAGRLPLDEVVIESDHDHLAVVPFRGSEAGPGYLLKSPADPAAALRLLRDQYDMVLVDLGHFSEDQTSPLMELIQSSIDSAILVHNVRSAYSGSLDQARRRLSSSGIAEVGVAENFV